MDTSTETQSNVNPHSLVGAVERTGLDTIKFSTLYHESDVLWIGGVVVGNVLEKKAGFNPWLIGAGIAGVVTWTEYQFSKLGVRFFEKPQDIVPDEKLRSKKEKMWTLCKETGALAYASYFGSANGVKINNSLGLKSTPRRRRIQAAAFGIGVGLWTTPTPLFEDGAEFAENQAKEAIQSPEKFAIYTAITVGSILIASKIVKESRKFANKLWRRHKERKAHPEPRCITVPANLLPLED